MAARKKRVALVVHDGKPVDSVLLSLGTKGDEYIEKFSGTIYVLDPEDEYGEDLIPLHGCTIVEVTGLVPQPEFSDEWSYVDGVWSGPSID